MSVHVDRFGVGKRAIRPTERVTQRHFAGLQHGIHRTHATTPVEPGCPRVHPRAPADLRRSDIDDGSSKLREYRAGRGTVLVDHAAMCDGSSAAQPDFPQSGVREHAKIGGDELTQREVRPPEPPRFRRVETGGRRTCGRVTNRHGDVEAFPAQRSERNRRDGAACARITGREDGPTTASFCG